MKNKYIKGDKVSKLIITRRNGDTYKILIDTEDLSRVLKKRWCVQMTRNKYVVSNTNSQRIYLHHFLIGFPPKDMETDHKDRDTLNNCKNNLSHVSLGQNKVNRRISNKHGFPGLEYIPDRKNSPLKRKKNIVPKPWHVRLRIKNSKSLSKNTEDIGTRLVSVGVFSTKKEAIEARRQAELKYFGSIFH